MSRNPIHWIVGVGILLVAVAASASIFGSVHGLIHDPQHRPVQDAKATLRSSTSEWAQSTVSNEAGEFVFENVPLGEYRVLVEVQGFASEQQTLVITAGRDAKPHFSLTVARAAETVEVQDVAPTINPESSTSTNIVNRAAINETPGADQANSLAMVTDYTPGAYMVHDQLHIRGGHQVSWLLDGVPVPNTNIASNVGPQFDPKDIDYLEVQRGGYNAEYGDRTYGVFNVVTRSGFERNRQGEAVLGYGSYNATNPQISLGDHTDRFAWYGSLSGYRTDIGLETPAAENLHNLADGLSGFGSLIFNQSPSDQLRLITSVRGDHYQVPNTPDSETQGFRDVEKERDTFVNFSWLHTAGTGVVLTVSPFYHFNRAHYLGDYTGTPDPNVLIPQDDRGSNYIGGVVSLAVTRGHHNLHTGVQIFGQRDNQLLGIVTSDGSIPPVTQRETLWGSVSALFVEDQYKLTRWLTLNGGVRLTHFGGTGTNTLLGGNHPISENAADPRLGAALQIPKLHWVARAFWGRYYQAPPLLTVSGPILARCNSADCGFLPLHGERDEQREFGLTIPLAGWTFDVANFRTAANNFFDHDVLGNSNIFFPLTIDRARIHGWEATANSPRIAGRAQFHLAYSHQYAEGAGAITGGLTDFSPPDEGYFFLDHDQRDTVSTGLNVTLPRHAWTAVNVNYGSGFLDGDGPGHLPSHTTVDLSLGKSFGENWSLRLSALNVGNNHYVLDNSNTFGGSHFTNPRELAFQVKYRFHF
ncbi:MAG TPA: TonB-dependent receptor [Terriglobales bacterium]|nr:TonB-dependent receptor [Terriglobales bacterium]